MSPGDGPDVLESKMILMEGGRRRRLRRSGSSGPFASADIPRSEGPLQGAVRDRVAHVCGSLDVRELDAFICLREHLVLSALVWALLLLLALIAISIRAGLMQGPSKPLGFALLLAAVSAVRFGRFPRLEEAMGFLVLRLYGGYL